MTSFPEGSLRLIADGVLVRGIQMLRQARIMLQRSGIEKDDMYLMEIRMSLRRMETEAKRRGLGIPEEPPEVQHLRKL